MNTSCPSKYTCHRSMCIVLFCVIMGSKGQLIFFLWCSLCMFVSCSLGNSSRFHIDSDHLFHGTIYHHIDASSCCCLCFKYIVLFPTRVLLSLLTLRCFRCALLLLQTQLRRETTSTFQPSSSKSRSNKPSTRPSTIIQYISHLDPQKPEKTIKSTTCAIPSTVSPPQHPAPSNLSSPVKPPLTNKLKLNPPHPQQQLEDPTRRNPPKNILVAAIKNGVSPSTSSWASTWSEAVMEDRVEIVTKDRSWHSKICRAISIWWILLRTWIRNGGLVAVVPVETLSWGPIDFLWNDE